MRLVQHCGYFRVQRRTLSSKDVGGCKGVRGAVHVCHKAAGFLHQQRACREVPRLQTHLKERRHPPRSDPRHVKGSRPQVAQPTALHRGTTRSIPYARQRVDMSQAQQHSSAPLTG